MHSQFQWHLLHFFSMEALYICLQSIRSPKQLYPLQTKSLKNRPKLCFNQLRQHVFIDYFSLTTLLHWPKKYIAYKKWSTSSKFVSDIERNIGRISMKGQWHKLMFDINAFLHTLIQIIHLKPLDYMQSLTVG